MLPSVHEATPDELLDWDASTVEPVGGNVLQSRAWGQYQAGRGLRPRYLVDDWGGRTLVLERPWGLIGGSAAYSPRGPVVGPGADPAVAAARVAAIAAWLKARGADAFASDAEVPASSIYARLLGERGFRPVEEVQPSRHRLSLPLAGASEAACLANLSMTARQRVRGAIRDGLTVIRYDARPVPADVRGMTTRRVDQLTADLLAPPLEAFHDVLLGTSRRRGYRMAPRQRFLDWSSRAVSGRLAIFLEVRAPDATLLAGGLFYRHGRRLTYATAGDRAELRRAYPGAMHLLLWRAIQIALAEGLDELDLAGVDVAGARHRPVAGDAMYGLLAFKESFGGQWVELSGNHQLTMRPLHHLAGRAAGRLVEIAGRIGLRGLTRAPAPA